MTPRTLRSNFQHGFPSTKNSKQAQTCTYTSVGTSGQKSKKARRYRDGVSVLLGFWEKTAGFMSEEGRGIGVSLGW